MERKLYELCLDTHLITLLSGCKENLIEAIINIDIDYEKNLYLDSDDFKHYFSLLDRFKNEVDSLTLTNVDNLNAAASKAIYSSWTRCFINENGFLENRNVEVLDE